MTVPANYGTEYNYCKCYSVRLFESRTLVLDIDGIHSFLCEE